MQTNFRPRHIQYANAKLDKVIKDMQRLKETNDKYKKGIFKVPFWKKFLGFFKS